MLSGKGTLLGNGVSSVSGVSYATIYGAGLTSSDELFEGEGKGMWASMVPLTTVDQYGLYCDQVELQNAKPREKRGKRRRKSKMDVGTFLLLDPVTEVGCYFSMRYVRKYVSPMKVVGRYRIKSIPGYVSSYSYYFMSEVARAVLVQYVNSRLSSYLLGGYVNMIPPNVKLYVDTGGKLTQEWWHWVFALDNAYAGIMVMVERVPGLPGEII